MDPNGTVALWGSIVGFLMPVLIAALNRRAWASEVKGLASFAACMIAAAGTAYFAGSLRASGDVATAAASVFGAAIVTYHQFFKPSGLTDQVEEKTG